MQKGILVLSLIVVGVFSVPTRAAPIAYVCANASVKRIKITFDDLVIAGQTPPTADVEVAIAAIPKVKWTTSMFLGLKLAGDVFVQFRKQTGPPDEINLQISSDLRTASASIIARDEGLDLQDLKCARK